MTQKLVMFSICLFDDFQFVAIRIELWIRVWRGHGSKLLHLRPPIRRYVDARESIWHLLPMKTEELRALIRQSHHKPVRICMDDGRSFTVSHPDYALVADTGIILASGPGHDLGNVSYTVLYFEHITRIEELKPKRKAA